MATRYWVISLPAQTSPSYLWSRLQESISKQSFDTPLYRFNIPDLRVGTLDSLLSLSDDLLKSNSFVEGVSHKIRRQIEELEKISGIESGSLTVDGVPIDSYITRFVWDEAKFPTMSPLRETVDGIHVQVAKIEDDLKVRVSEYNNVRSQLNAINRKQSGSLAVRDLSTELHCVTPKLSPPYTLSKKSKAKQMAALDLWLLRELCACALLFFLTRFFLRQVFLRPKRTLPPGPRGWPVLGCLLLLGKMPHVTLFEMAKRYGPVMYLRLGTSSMVVASTPEAARAFLKTLDLNFSNRPPNGGATHLAYNAQDMVFADYGQRWKLERKICNLHMLGGKALDDWSHVRSTELGYMLKAMAELSSKGEPVTVPEMLTYAMANMIGQIILSKRVFHSAGAKSNEFKDMVVELMTSAGLFNIGDFIPSIAWMDLQGIEVGMRRLHKKFDALLTTMIDEHVSTKHQRRGNPDFLDVVMSEGAEGGLTLIHIKALLLNLFTAGTDTSSSIIEWAMAEMLNNPSILRRAQSEMDQVIGRNRRLQESDIPKLPYLQAICKETFRKHPSTPLNLPRVSTQPCEVGGYYIPKNTRLMVNIWGIGRDPNVWENPLDFNPDRFMSGRNAKIDPRGNDFELIPFGAGRRICAGTRMGIVLVENILGTLVHSFDWRIHDGVKLNMDEVFGLALQKAVPVSAMVTPRLSPRLYE